MIVIHYFLCKPPNGDSKDLRDGKLNGLARLRKTRRLPTPICNMALAARQLEVGSLKSGTSLRRAEADFHTKIAYNDIQLLGKRSWLEYQHLPSFSVLSQDYSN